MIDLERYVEVDGAVVQLPDGVCGECGRQVLAIHGTQSIAVHCQHQRLGAVLNTAILGVAWRLYPNMDREEFMRELETVSATLRAIGERGIRLLPGERH